MLARWTIFILAVAPLAGVSIMDPRLPGIAIDFNASLEPAGAGPAELPGTVQMGAGRAYRVIQDAAHQIYFGYDVIVEPSPDGKNFQVRAAPLTASPDKLRGMGLHPAWKKQSLSSEFSLPEIRTGNKIKLKLLVNPTTGQQIVDTISIRERGESKSAPRDFTVADAELRFPSVQLRVDGELVPTGSAGTTGAAVWFYAAGHGRLVFSLAPHPNLGFTKIGVVSGTRLTITEGSTVYQLESADTIASTTGSFNVYGRHDRTWMPPGGGNFAIGSADRAESVR